MTDWNLGDLLLLPNGTIEEITGYSAQREQVETSSGFWHQEDIEAVPKPTELTAMEEWLAGPTWRVFRGAPAIVVANGRCADENHQCSCKQCYANTSINPVTGQAVGRHHFRDNAACECATKGCICVVTD